MAKQQSHDDVLEWRVTQLERNQSRLNDAMERHFDTDDKMAKKIDSQLHAINLRLERMGVGNSALIKIGEWFVLAALAVGSGMVTSWVTQ